MINSGHHALSALPSRPSSTTSSRLIDHALCNDAKKSY
jgi:hypothetical protein